MFAVQTPTFFLERAVDQLSELLPADAIGELRANFRAFRSWVAEPAFRKETPEAAVQHVLASVGPAAQFKAEFFKVIASIPRGVELLTKVVTEELVGLTPATGPERLSEAADHLQRAQRMWLRFVAFHPDLVSLEAAVGGEHLGSMLTLCFHADNLLAVCFMAADGESGAVSPGIVTALCGAAADLAERYHVAVREVVERFAPRLDEDDPFKPSTVADLLALPPYDGPAATVEEMDDAIGSLFSPP